MHTAYQQQPREIAFVLSLPAGRQRNAGLNELASRYQRRLESYIRCELKSTRWSRHLDAEDLVQSLYLKLLTVEPQDQIQDERHLLNWLQCVLRNHMLEEAKALKARKRDVSRVTPLPDHNSEETGVLLSANDDHRPGVSPRCTQPSAEADRNEDARRFRDFLAAAQLLLSEADWELFRRHHIEDVSQSVLAGELGRSPAAVCMRLKGIRVALRRHFPRYADLVEE